MNDDVGFEFPVDTADEWSGFNDPGMEHFSGNPYVHVGKEVPQNTIDALQQVPARLEFRLAQVPVDSIPGVDELRKALHYCLREAPSESEKAVGFFEEAHRLLSSSSIHVLIVSDSNTTGIIGPSTKGQPYHAFMKGIGQSKKDSDTGLGSFGIGKFAPFTVSKLRTVFVSTVWDAADGETHYVQGKAILMSHRLESGVTRKAVGYWGVRNLCKPVTGPDAQIPTWLDRTHLGTTLAILGFEPVHGWDKLLAASVSQNFFGAISDGTLVAKVGEIELVPDTLPGFLGREDVRDLVKENQKDPEQFHEAGLFLTALGSQEEVIVENTENLYLGNCELRIRVQEGLPKRVAVLRDGMFITSELSQLKRFSDFKDFVAVVRCKSDKGNRLLRAMEPPRHDDFEPQRLLDPEEQRRGKAALKEIGSWVREMLKRHARDEVADETTIDELADYFSDEQSSSSASKGPREGEADPRGRIIVRARPVKRAPIRPHGGNEPMGTGEPEGGSGVGSEPASGGGDSSVDGGSGRGKGNEGGGGAMAIALIDVRAVPLGGSRRQISFKADHDGLVSLRLQASGADNNHPLSVVTSTMGEVNQGSVTNVKVERGVRYYLNVTLDREFPGAMRISANAV